MDSSNWDICILIQFCRRYSGHKPTIRPNAKKLYRLFNDRHNMTWHDFASQIRTFQVGFMGEPNEVKPGRGEFHEHPLPCICQKRGDSARPRNDVDRNSEANDEDEEQYLSETEYAEEDRVVPNRRDSGSRTDHPELDEILSD